MENYAKFRTFLMGAMASGVIGLTTLVLSAQIDRISKVESDNARQQDAIDTLKTAIERLKTLQEVQAQINERLARAEERTEVRDTRRDQ